MHHAFRAKWWSVMGLTLERTLLILLYATVSIVLFWCNMKPILLLCGQDESIINLASTYIVFSLPDLVTQAFLRPFKIYHDEPYFHLFYFIEKFFKLTCSFQCWSNSSCVSPPTTWTSLDPNPRLYQASKRIKSLEVQPAS